MLKNLLFTAAAASAATVVINVGQSGLTFSPDSNTANQGDILEYHFFGGPHSVVMGDFNNPCKPAATGGFFSGAMTSSGENSNVFQVMVNSTDPIFFYCGTPTHCGSGMVGVVNPSSSETFDAFQKAASGASTTTPANAFGGTVVSGSSSSSSPTPSPSSSSGGSGGGGGPYGGGSGSATPGAAGTLRPSLYAALGAICLVMFMI